MEKTKEKVEIKNISYSFGHKVKNITDEQLKEMSLQEIHKQLEKMYRKGNLTGLEISAKSDNFMHTLCIYFEKANFCIGIMDDWKETALLYDSGEGEEPAVIRGNYYPKHMVSDNEELLFMVVDEFLQHGKPTKKVKWTKG